MLQNQLLMLLSQRKLSHHTKRRSHIQFNLYQSSKNLSPSHKLILRIDQDLHHLRMQMMSTR